MGAHVARAAAGLPAALAADGVAAAVDEDDVAQPRAGGTGASAASIPLIDEPVVVGKRSGWLQRHREKFELAKDLPKFEDLRSKKR